MIVYGSLETHLDVGHMAPLEGILRAAAVLVKQGLQPLVVVVEAQDYVSIEMGLHYAARYEGDALVLHTPRSLYVEVSSSQPEGVATMIYRKPGDDYSTNNPEKKVKVLLAR